MWHTDSSFDIIVRQSHFDSTFPFSEPTRTPAIVLALTYLVLADNFPASGWDLELFWSTFSPKSDVWFSNAFSACLVPYSPNLTASDISGKAEAIKPVAFAILPHIHFPSLLEAMGRLHWCLHVLLCDLFSPLINLLTVNQSLWCVVSSHTIWLLCIRWDRFECVLSVLLHWEPLDWFVFLIR